jgi:hypothetical protein
MSFEAFGEADGLPVGGFVEGAVLGQVDPSLGRLITQNLIINQWHR